MTPERWQQVKSVSQAALERDAGERERFLDAACDGDEALRTEVASLLAEQEKLSGFIAAPAVGEIRAESLPGTMNRRIGPYRIERELGRGGMGVVYLAERDDDQFRKQVAIKLIRRGFDVVHVINRFRYERQILASLDHPNIARLLDGGTAEEGLPYFVMEYVEGRPIDDYCDERRLNTEARLELFRKVCAAVQYAHRNLVVHRDLKPGNILITEDGEPKLLDFGIAKLLNPEAFPNTFMATRTWERPMTPAYASPEQARGLPVTTSSDIYSLGVVLYELLTGHRPYQVDASGLPHELARVICEQEPERPSTAITRVEVISEPPQGETIRVTPDSISRMRNTQPARLRRQLKGDLDNVVLMALRKEPQRRYASVEQFSEDIGHYLEGRPVIARPATAAYRAAKFVGRHKAGVIAGALAVLALIGGALATAWQAQVARAQKARAEKRFNDVRRLANSFMFEFHDEILTLPGSTKARELVVNRALEYLGSLSQEASGDPALQRELATAYARLGDAQGHPAFPNLGDTAGSLRSYRKGLELIESAAAAAPDDLKTRRFLAIIVERIGDVLARTGDLDGTRESYGRTLKLRESLLAADPKSEQALREVGVSYERIGDLMMKTLDTAGALEHHRKALANSETLLSPKPQDRLARRDMTVSLDRMGDVLIETGDLKQALDFYRRSQQLREALLAEERNNEALRDLSISGNKIGDALLKTGDVAGAIGSYRRAMELAEELSRKDPNDAQARGDVAFSHLKLGNALSQADSPAEASRHYQLALKSYEQLRAADPANTQTRGNLAMVYDGLGELLAKRRDVAGAMTRHGQARAIFESLSAEDQADALARRDLALSHIRSGWTLINAGEPKTAAEHFRHALSILEPLSANDSINALTRKSLADAAAGMSECLVFSGDCAGASDYYRRAAIAFETLAATGLVRVEEKMRSARGSARCETASKH
jgi:non-specific serine/threonine protein kinase/serine/threonine-protein kinase